MAHPPTDNLPAVARLLDPPEQHWVCPNCTTTSVTHLATPHTQFHACPALQLTAPLIPDGTRAEVIAVEREDYIGTDDARPDGIMSVVTKRDDGQDCTVMAPTATAAGG